MAESHEVLVIERAYLGQLEIGVGQIASRLNGQAEIDGAFERGQAKMVAVDNENTACCIDGRCAICLIADVIEAETINFMEAQFDKVPVVAKVPGGAYHHATMMAIGAGWAPIAHTKNFDEAQAIVGGFLGQNGIYDTRHSSIRSFNNPDATECGAVDKDTDMARAAAEESQLLDATGDKGAINRTMDALVGDDAQDKAVYESVRREHARVATPAYFAESSAARDRDNLDGSHVELLESDESPTHMHVEQAIVVNNIAGMTIDRDANNGELFWYDKWFNDKLATLMGGSDLEVTRLALAGDYHTITVAHQLVAPGMPTALFKAAA